MKIESRWEGLTNPELDPAQVEGGEEGIRGHASTRMKERYGDEAWSVVRVEGRDWGRVLGVGRLGGRVIACESKIFGPATRNRDIWGPGVVGSTLTVSLQASVMSMR